MFCSSSFKIIKFSSFKLFSKYNNLIISRLFFQSTHLLKDKPNLRSSSGPRKSKFTKEEISDDENEEKTEKIKKIKTIEEIEKLKIERKERAEKKKQTRIEQIERSKKIKEKKKAKQGKHDEEDDEIEGLLKSDNNFEFENDMEPYSESEPENYKKRR